MSNLCLVIPAHNEQTAIGGVVKDSSSALKKSSHKVTVVVVDDASIDRTAENARKAGAIVVRHIINQGAGGATLTGLQFAKKRSFDYVITMDADGQHSPEDALNCLNETIKSESDLLIGSRLVGSDDMPRIKRFFTWGGSVLTFILFGVKVSDPQSGLRVFSKKTVEGLEWKSTGYEFCNEMLWRAKQAKLKISEYPIRVIYTEYSRSKGQNKWNSVHIIKSLIRQRVTELFE
jgi:glycosyltransferase involved in cell wall biosynthesis